MFNKLSPEVTMIGTRCYFAGISSVLIWSDDNYKCRHIDLDRLKVSSVDIDHYLLQNNVEGKLDLVDNI